MAYNIHPIFVHFPIAFLLLYSFVKIIPVYKWLPNVAWGQIQRLLLLVGVLGAFVASSTGEIAEELTRPDRQLVNMHSTFASLSTWIYALLLVGEILILLIPVITRKLNIQQLTNFLTFVKNLLTHKLVSGILAFVGLIAITVTGLLGGVMVYGTSADPLAGIVLKILGISF
jgi:uncharacterized membrane protein